MISFANFYSVYFCVKKNKGLCVEQSDDVIQAMSIFFKKDYLELLVKELFACELNRLYLRLNWAIDFLEADVQKRIKKIWTSKVGRRHKSKLNLTEEARYLNDISTMLSLGMSGTSIARWISAFYSVSYQSTISRIHKFRNCNVCGEIGVKVSDAVYESGFSLNRRKRIVLNIFILCMEGMENGEVGDCKLARKMAIAIFTVAYLCANLRISRNTHSFAWWFVYTEKIVAGAVPIKRRERISSPLRY